MCRARSDVSRGDMAGGEMAMLRKNCTWLKSLWLVYQVDTRGCLSSHPSHRHYHPDHCYQFNPDLTPKKHSLKEDFIKHKRMSVDKVQDLDVVDLTKFRIRLKDPSKYEKQLWTSIRSHNEFIKEKKGPGPITHKCIPPGCPDWRHRVVDIKPSVRPQPGERAKTKEWIRIGRNSAAYTLLLDTMSCPTTCVS